MARRSFFGKSIEYDTAQLFLGALVYALLIVCLISVALVSYATYFADGMMFLPYVLLVPAFLFFVFRRVAMPLWTMFILFMIFSAFPLLLLFFRPLSEALFLCFNAFIMAMISISARYKSNDNVKVGLDQLGTTMFIHGFFLIVSGLIDYSGHLKYYLLSHTLLSLCIFFLARQRYVFETTYGHIANSPTQPSAAVRERHNRTIIMLCIFSLMIIPVVILFPYSVLTDLLREGFRLFLKAIFYVYELLKKWNLIPNAEKAEPIPDFKPVTPEDSDPILGVILEVFLNLLSVTVVLAFLLFTIRGAYRFIVMMYRRSSNKADASVDALVIDEVFSIQKKKRRTSRRPDFGEGEEKEIRRKYFQAVRRAIRDGAEIDPSYSPREINKAISGLGEEDFGSLSARYEKFRYGTGSNSISLSEKES